MSITDSTYLVGEIKIPNTDTNQHYINRFIDIVEDVELRNALGEDLKNAFEAGLLEDPVPQKWLDLRDGKSYTINYQGNNFTIKWNGLANSLKKSFLSYWVYCAIQRDSATQTTGIGQKLSSSETATNANPESKIIHAHNEALKLYGNPIYGYIHSDCIINDPFYGYCGFDYPYFNDTVCLHTDIVRPTLYNFITAMNEKDETTYPNWVFTVKKRINFLGI